MLNLVSLKSNEFLGHPHSKNCNKWALDNSSRAICLLKSVCVCAQGPRAYQIYCSNYHYLTKTSLKSIPKGNKCHHVANSHIILLTLNQPADKT